MRLILFAAVFAALPASAQESSRLQEALGLPEAALSEAIAHPDARLLSADEVEALGLASDGPAWFVPLDAAQAPSLGYELPLRASEKEEGIGMIIGVLIPGGGQFYAGDTTKGLTILGLGYGSWIGSLILASALNTGEIAFVGLAGLIGATVYGVLETPDDVRAANARNGFAVAPSVTRTDGGYAGGLSLRASF